MEKRVGQVERKKRGFSVGTLFLGIFLGLLLTIGAIVGAGYFIINKVTVNWINDKFNQTLDLGSSDLNNTTIKDFVSHAINLAQNIDTYTLNDLKNDFGIDFGGDIAGIDISDLKSVAIKDLISSIQNKLSNISVSELTNLIDMSGIDSLMNKTTTYYFNAIDSKLYKTQAYTDEVDFAYTVAMDKIIIKGREFNIISDAVSIQLRYLPLTIAFDKISGDIDGDTITLAELENDYNVTLPSFFDNISRSTTLNNLSFAIDNLYVYDLLGYSVAGDIVYNKSGGQVNGIVAAIAKMRIGNLDEAIADLTVADLFDTDSGVLSLINPNTTINNLPSALSAAMTSSTIDQLYTANIISQYTNYSVIKDKYIDIGSGTYKQVKDLLLIDIVNLFFSLAESGGILQDSI